MYFAIVIYIWRMRFVFRLSWIGILVFIVASHVWRTETPEFLGFRVANLERSFRRFASVVLGITAVLLALAALFRTFRSVNAKSAAASLVLYCAWGLFQQYLLNGYFVNRLVSAFPGASPCTVAALAAVLFAGVHLPNWFLTAVTLVGGYFCARLYISYRNLFFLGLAHGLVGFVIYLTVPDSISRHLYVGPKWFQTGRG